MKGRQVILLLLGCAIAATVVVFLCLRKKEPAYNGKTLTEWVLMYVLSSSANSAPRNSVYDPVARQESEEAVRKIGTNALPWLVKWIQREPSYSRQHKLGLNTGKLPGGQSDTPIRDRLFADRGWVKEEVAMAGFQILGTNASGAVPELLRLLEDRKSPRLTQKVLSALYSIDEDGMPHLLAILQNPKDPCRADVATLFQNCARLGTNATLAVRLLSECVTDKDTHLAVRAIESLGWLACEPEIAIPALANGLLDPREDVQRGCAWSLGHFGAAARVSVPALTAALQHPNWNVRSAATGALSKIAPWVLSRLKPSDEPQALATER